MGTYENLSVKLDDGVGRIVMDSTSRMNALNPEMVDELLDVVVELNEDKDVRCITLRGNEEAYNTGFDLSLLDGDESDAEKLRQVISTLHDAILHLHRAEKPTLAGVNGVAAGAGFSLAIFPDIVLVGEDARLEYAYNRIALTGDGGSTFFLPRLVGLRRAREIALLDETIGSNRAVELGLATESVESDNFEDRLDELSRRLADGPTKAHAETARLMGESFGHSLEEQLGAETEAMARATHTDDFARGIEAFFEDEDPEFEGT